MKNQNLNNAEPLVDFIAEDNNEKRDKFLELYSINLNDKAETKNNLTYISWPHAWKEFKKVYPNASYNIVKNPQTGLPYFYDERMGVIVYTEVTVEEQTYQMWLPVMDGANKTMKFEPYTYQVWDKQNKRYVDKKVEAVSMFDVNKTLMRCLVKNLAMFGLGLYIYAGEDLPETATENPAINEPEQKQQRRTRRQTTDRLSTIKMAIASTMTTQDLVNLYQQHQQVVEANQDIKALFTERKMQLIRVH